jgi:glycosyltransferase involved in cell wall biosynthesis
MHVAHFVHRYPPAVGGAEAYFARLGGHLAAAGDDVTVWTTTAVDLEAFWSGGRAEVLSPSPRWGEGLGVRGWTASRACVAGPPLTPGPSPQRGEGSQTVRRYRPARFPLRRYLLKAASLVPVPPLQALTLPCNPVCPAMWRDAGRFAGPLDAVHATAFPYSFPILCGLRLARHRGVPFLLTPFLHLGDPADPSDRTRRQYTQPALRWLLRQADRVFVQTPGERAAVVGLGVPPDRVVLQGLGVEPAECTGGGRDTARRAWGVGPGDFVIGHLANNSVEKGTVDLLTAAAGLPANLRVVLAGPEMPNFRRFWEGYPRQDRVTRLGVLSDAGKRDFYAGIDAFALPSRTDSFGLVLLEAWANGKPVIVYRAGGPGEIVRDGEDGVVTDCNSAALAAGLTRLTDGALRAMLGERGRRVGVEFRWQDKLDLVRDVIEEVRREQRVAGLVPAVFVRSKPAVASPAAR